jgi:hypothetical protein
MDIDEATHFVLEKVLFPSGGGSGGGRGSGSGYTVWSVNYGLSGNLWKPPATDRGGFWQVSGF